MYRVRGYSLKSGRKFVSRSVRTFQEAYYLQERIHVAMRQRNKRPVTFIEGQVFNDWIGVSNTSRG